MSQKEDREKVTETLANLNLKLLLSIISHEKSVQQNPIILQMLPQWQDNPTS